MAVRWNWGLGLALAYGIFASATVGFAWFAMTERVDLVSDDYYAQALAHDARQAATARVEGLGDAFGIDSGPADRRLVVRWPRDMASAMSGSIRLYRPADASADRSTPIAPAADGRQAVSLEGLAAGRWIVKVHWTAGGQDFYAEQAVHTR